MQKLFFFSYRFAETKTYWCYWNPKFICIRHYRNDWRRSYRNDWDGKVRMMENRCYRQDWSYSQDWLYGWDRPYWCKWYKYRPYV